MCYRKNMHPVATEMLQRLKKKKQKIISAMFLISIALPALTGIIVVLFGMATGQHPVSTNGWDESTYLSWGNARIYEYPGIQNGSYWLGSMVTWIGHQAGLSGTMINILCDTVLTLLIAILIIQISKNLEVPLATSICFAALAISLTLFFNYSNPLVANLKLFDPTAILTSSKNTYIPHFRTPNPQLTLIVIIIETIAILSTLPKIIKNFVIAASTLMVALTGYLFLLPGYFCITIPLIASRIMKKNIDSKRIVLVASSGISTIIFILTSIFFGKSLQHALQTGTNSSVLKYLMDIGRLQLEYHSPIFTFTSLVALACCIVVTKTAVEKGNRYSEESSRNKIYYLCLITILLTLASIYSTNLQVFSGYLLESKGFIDYGSNIWGCLAIGTAYLSWEKLRANETP